MTCLIMFLVFTTIATNVRCQDARPPPNQELAVEDLKDLLLTSIQQTVSLNELVTQLTQKIVNTMLSVSEITTKVEKIEKSLNQEIEGIKAGMEEEVQALKHSVQKLKNSSEEVEKNFEALKSSSQANFESQESKLNTLEDTVDALETRSSEVKIVNGEESAGNAKCSTVCAGTTGRSSTTTVYHSSTIIYIDVDISGCGFVKIPTVTTSLEGAGGHYVATGAATPYSVTTAGFRIYIKNDHYKTEGVENAAKRLSWNVEWVAVGYTC